MASFRQIAQPHPPPVVSPPAPHSNPQFQPYPYQQHGGSVPAHGRVPPVSASHAGFAGSFTHPVSQQQYPYAPPFPQAPPPPSESYAPSVYYPSSQHPLQDNQPSHPPPPSSSPPNHSLPPPPSPTVPPPSVPPPPPLSNQTQPNLPSMNVHHQGTTRVDPPGHQHKPTLPLKQQEPPSRPTAGRVPIHAGGPNGASSRVETEGERRMRKKREYEKQKHEERRQLLLKHSQSIVLQKTNLLAGNARPSGSMTGSHVADQRTSSLLVGEKIENRLKKPTTFICKMKFRNELPDPTTQPKLLALNKDKDRFSRYTITSLEKMHKPKLYIEQDLGIPLDLLDMSVYNPHAVHLSLAHEDEELLHEDELVAPVKPDGIRRKERPMIEGVSWLVKTQYISPISTEVAKKSVTAKQAKEMRETREGRSKYKQLKNLSQQPNCLLSINLNLDWNLRRFGLCYHFSTGDPTADLEKHSKLDRSSCHELQSQAIMKSFIMNGSDPNNPEKFLAYMTPAPDQLHKDETTRNEDTTYNWHGEYHWDARGEDINDPTTYLVTFGEKDALYLPLPTKIVLLSKRVTETRPRDEIEHFPVPSSVIVRKKSDNTAEEPNEYEEPYGKMEKLNGMKRKRGDSSMYKDSLDEQHTFLRTNGLDQFSEEEDLSD
ncbi:protein PAF1 homolog isoform X2 [Zingiber officinale]|uniref:protein PAF1 homolog isoform X2 n=1 Tax=Zingiber officinale TaxID=94328 RepID=UPI001C4B7FFE|nr:protein PAF1 homolog isoform X2 [Zingiber officinale]